MPYIEPTHDSVTAWIDRGVSGPVVMLSLLRFRELADYSQDPELAPDEPISGADAYRRYEDHTQPFLHATGGRVLFRGEGGPPVIGPSDERWDLALLVRHRNVRTFLSFADDAAYLAGVGHRTAALADSRLVPLIRTSGR